MVLDHENEYVDINCAKCTSGAYAYAAARDPEAVLRW
jgi:hypothetical protein